MPRALGAGTVRTRAATIAAWSAILVLAVGVGVVAGRATFVPPRPEAAPSPVQMYTVADGAVGSSAAYTATVTWPTRPLGVFAGQGTVTGVAVASGQTVDSGDVLWSVDLRPVVVARGDVPSFRDIALGMSGADVRQLQELLVVRGHLRATVTDRFTATVEAAVKRWQKELGVEQTGAVMAADVVYATDLPARVVLDKGITAGARLEPGAEALSAADPSPLFTLEIGLDSRAAVPPTGAAVEVSVDGQVWQAVIGEARTSDTQQSLVLTAPDGGPVCGAGCTVPFTTDSLRYPAKVILAAEVAGPMVPLAALGTDASGSSYLVAPSGELLAVTVLATDGSRAVVDGVRPGDVVRLLGAESGGEKDDRGAAAEPSGTA